MLELALLLTVATCSWNQPGQNPFMGDLVEAVDHYRDIPPPARAALKEKVRTHNYDDIATITDSHIVGNQQWGDLRDMHFNTNRVCRQPDRSGWGNRVERGLVYCYQEHCVIVPTVCRNLSRVTRMTPPKTTVPHLELELEVEVPGGWGLVRQALLLEGFQPPQVLVVTTEPSRPDRVWSKDPLQVVWNTDNTPPTPPITTPIPEPTTWWLIGLGLGVMWWKLKKKTR